MFKEKTSKKRLPISENKKELSTLDVMHNKMIQTIHDKNIETKGNQEYLNELNQIIEIIKIRIQEESNNINSEEYNLLWSSNIQLKEDIIKLNNIIKRDINEYNELEYYNNTSDILFNYYDLLEKQSKNTKKNKQCFQPTNKTILDALNNLSNNIGNIIVNNNTPAQKSDLVDEYLFITDKNHIKKIEYDDIELCRCCKEPMTCLQHDAIIICENCGYQELLLVEQNRPILKQNNKDVSHFSYKRINHFREWCNQVQGKESTDIPNEIFEKILNEIKKEKISNTKNITYSKMREILKRLRINKYYEHINYIINRINGIPTPQFSPELEEKLFLMFRDIQGPFLKHCPKERKNFLSYSYVLYKFFQILGLNEYLKFFPLLKSREKLYVQDQIWKKICEELNYEFHPSPLL